MFVIQVLILHHHILEENENRKTPIINHNDTCLC